MALGAVVEAIGVPKCSRPSHGVCQAPVKVLRENATERLSCPSAAVGAAASLFGGCEGPPGRETGGYAPVSGSFWEPKLERAWRPRSHARGKDSSAWLRQSAGPQSRRACIQVVALNHDIEPVVPAAAVGSRRHQSPEPTETDNYQPYVYTSVSRFLSNCGRHWGGKADSGSLIHTFSAQLDRARLPIFTSTPLSEHVSPVNRCKCRVRVLA